VSQTTRAESVVRPFRALRYDTSLVDPADVVSPPYDVIDEAGRLELLARSPYNVVRLILPGAGHESEAGETFERWIAEGILVREPRPSAWWLEQEATGPDGVRRLRSGLIATVRVDAYGEGAVRPHERTLDGPKAGRLALMRAVGANLSPIFAIYDDPASTVTALVDDHRAGVPPLIDVRDADGTDHRLWRIDDPDVLEAIGASLAPLPLVIADGHHRYETALAYRNESRERTGKTDPMAGTEFAMATFVNTHSKGLVILPTHRVVSRLPNFNFDEFRQAAGKYFDWYAYPFSNAEERPAAYAEFRKDFQSGRHGRRAIGVYGTSGDVGRAFYLFALRKDADLSQLLNDVSEDQRGVDVVLLHRLVLEKVLGITAEAVTAEKNVTYERETDVAIAAVDSGGAQLALLLNPVSVEQVAQIALAGDVMPQKSTDFYPKLLSGLAIFRPEGTLNG
jgi:uncharacterized protein (DUF1015 family)